MSSISSSNSPIHWSAAITLFGTSFTALIFIPSYAWFYDYSTAAWLSFVILAILNGISITAGYHRLWAHRTYQAHWSVQIIFMLFGTMAVQNSILIWASGHRNHHRHVDNTEFDPYSIKRGFWFSHMGWMIRKYESGKEDFSNSPDLLKNRLVMFQHKYYIALALGTNFLLPALIGFWVGDLWGVILLGGLLRLVWCHQTTFFINSLAHIWGRRPYTDENTARDNDFLAIFTYGEGYHNYHHLFQYDYRNGIKWYQIDPTKWLIAALSIFGLTKNLQRTDNFAIEKARIAMQFKRAEEKLLATPTAMQVQIGVLKVLLTQEYECFSKAIQAWAKLKEAWYEDTKSALRSGETMAIYKLKFHALEVEMRLQRKRLQTLVSQVHHIVSTQSINLL
jgi:stearoyl-CoA desaturase (delta-9 desaturase)